MQFTFSLSSLKAFVTKLKEDALVLWFARKHKDTPLMAKVLCFTAVAYALSPIDLIPDFIPVIGRLDDMLVLPGAIWLAFKLLPAGVITDCQQQADDFLAKEPSLPKSIFGMVTGSSAWVITGLHYAQKFLPFKLPF